MEKPQTDLVTSAYEIPITPDQLMIAARRLELSARTAYPGQKIYLRITPNIMFTYDPRISTSDMLIRSNVRLPGTEISQLLDRKISDEVLRDETVAAAAPSN